MITSRVRYRRIIFRLMAGMFSLLICLPVKPQQVLRKARIHGERNKLQYWLYLPPSYREEKKEWPLLLFLHGAGERGDDPELVKKHGPPRLIQEGRQFDFIVLSPQCPEGQWWSHEVLSRLLDKIERRYRVDPDRIWVTGLSMGGFGTWDLAMSDPGRFAAIIPICGDGDVNKVDVLRDMPVWVFHGAKDDVVPAEKSENLVNRLLNIGAPVKFTLYDEAGHDSWTATYANPALWQWLEDQSRAKK